jgi:hypothetical protein
MLAISLCNEFKYHFVSCQPILCFSFCVLFSWYFGLLFYVVKFWFINVVSVPCFWHNFWHIVIVSSHKFTSGSLSMTWDRSVVFSRYSGFLKPIKLTAMIYLKYWLLKVALNTINQNQTKPKFTNNNQKWNLKKIKVA